MRIFESLGDEIAAAWSRNDCDERALPGIASAALARSELHKRVAPNDILSWLMTSHALPEQDDIEAKFGEPPITLYHGRRFYIQAIFWLNSTTSIHRHGFVGAFTVLRGSSLHSQFSFAPGRRFSSSLVSGDVRFASTELLSEGSVVEINHDLIHSLFHLEPPSVSIVVRTYGDPMSYPQYEYRPPFIAVDPFVRDPQTVRRAQALRMLLLAGQTGSYQALASALIEATDAHTAWLALEQGSRFLGLRGPMVEVLDAARRRHGELVDVITPVLTEELRRRKLIRLRATVKDPELRLFLALLLNLPSRAAIFDVVRRWRPAADPRALVLHWLERLSGVDVIGVDFNDELNKVLLGALLEGGGRAHIDARLAAEFGPEQVAQSAAAITAHINRLRRTALEPLLVD